MYNPLFDLIKDTVKDAISFKVDKNNRTVDIKDKDGTVTTISFDYNTNDNFLLKVAVHNYEYQIDGVKKFSDLPKIDCSGEQGNTLWLLNRYKNDYDLSLGTLNVFMSWKREEIVDFLSNHYILLNT